MQYDLEHSAQPLTPSPLTGSPLPFEGSSPYSLYVVSIFGESNMIITIPITTDEFLDRVIHWRYLPYSSGPCDSWILVQRHHLLLANPSHGWVQPQDPWTFPLCPPLMPPTFNILLCQDNLQSSYSKSKSFIIHSTSVLIIMIGSIPSIPCHPVLNHLWHIHCHSCRGRQVGPEGSEAWWA